MKNRKAFGHTEDARVTAETKLADPRATARIIEAVDWELVEYLRKRRLEAALSLLSRRDREFAKRVLEGMTWERSGIPKRTFNWRLKKILKNFHTNKHWLK